MASGPFGVTVSTAALSTSVLVSCHVQQAPSFPSVQLLAAIGVFAERSGMGGCRRQGQTAPLPGNNYESEPQAGGAAVIRRVAVGAWMGGARGLGSFRRSC